MASNDVMIKLVADVSGLNKELNSVKKQLNGVEKSTEGFGKNVSKTFERVGTVIAGAFAIDKIKDFTVSMLEATASVNALDSMFEQTFKGEQAKALEKISEQAEEQGIKVDRLKETWSSFYGTFRGNGADANESLALTERYMKLAGDGAAYYDMTLEEVVSRLKSLTMGNFEAGDAIGININATKMNTIATEKLGKEWKDLNDTEKEFLLIDVAETIYENSGAMGQGARESESWANVLENLKSVWERFLAIIGQPVLEKVIDHIQELITKIENASAWVTEFKEVFDDCYKSTGDFAEALASTFDSMDMKWAGDFVMAIDGVIDKIKEVIEWFKEHELATQILVGFILGLIGVFGALKLAMDISSAVKGFNSKLDDIAYKVLDTALKINSVSFSGFVGTVKTTFSTIGTFMGTIFTSLGMVATSPITWIIAGIVALIAVGYLLIKNWDKVKEVAQQVWTAVKDWCISTWESIKEKASEIWNSITEAVGTAVESVKEVVINIWTTIKDTVSGILTSIKDFFVGIWEGIKSFIETVMDAIFTVITTIWESVYVVIKPILDIIKTVSIAVWQGIQMAIAVILTIIFGIIKVVWEGIKLVIETILNAILTIVTFIWGLIKGAIELVLNIIITIAETAWKYISMVIETILNFILGIVKTIWGAIKTAIEFVLDIIMGIVKTVWGAIKDFMKGILDGILGIVKTVWGNIKDAVKWAVDGVKDLVSSGFTWVKDKAVGIFNGLKDAVMGIWTGIGKGIQGVVNGIISVINGMVRAMNKISFDVPDWIPVMGGKTFGFNIPEVPKVSWFANGGIIKGTEEGTIVGVGEAGDEAILPLSNKSKMLPFARAVADMMPDNTERETVAVAGSGVAINIEKLSVREEADVQKIAELLFKLQERNRRARGKN